MWHSTSDTAAATTLPVTLLAMALDEVDYGIALVDGEAQVLHMNRRARRVLQADGPLQVADERLRTLDERDHAQLHEGLSAAAGKGLRRLLSLGRGDARQVAALVPVQPGTAALLLGRSQVCEDLTLQCFARSHQLSPTETRVLAALGSGVSPSALARAHGVKMSTVRTQIRAIRDKTGVDSITGLVRLVAALPPIVGALAH